MSKRTRSRRSSPARNAPRMSAPLHPTHCPTRAVSEAVATTCQAGGIPSADTHPDAAAVLFGGAGVPGGGADVRNGADYPGSPTDVDSDDNSSETGEHASQGHGGGHQQESEAAAPVLKVGGKAKHPTLGHVTILVLGPLGAKIEFFSNVSQSIKERNVLLVDLEPLPDELLPDDIRGDSNGGGDADTTPAAEQARRPHESNTRALSAV